MTSHIPKTLTLTTSSVFPNVKKVEDLKNARFVGDFGLRNKNDDDMLTTCAVFWVATPEKPEYSNYFALYHSPLFGGALAFSDGQYSVKHPITGLCLPSGEIIFSRHRHHMHEATTAPISIDGGRDYMKLSHSPDIDMRDVHVVSLTVEDGIIRVEHVEAESTGDKNENSSNG